MQMDTRYPQPGQHNSCSTFAVKLGTNDIGPYSHQYFFQYHFCLVWSQLSTKVLAKSCQRESSLCSISCVWSSELHWPWNPDKPAARCHSLAQSELSIFRSTGGESSGKPHRIVGVRGKLLWAPRCWPHTQGHSSQVWTSQTTARKGRPWRSCKGVSQWGNTVRPLEFYTF